MSKKILGALAAIPICLLLFITIFFGDLNADSSLNFEGDANVSEDVLKFKPIVEAKAKEYDIPEYVNVILAIIQVETGGKGLDVMQSSESLGLPPNAITDPVQSIDAGVKLIAGNVGKARAFGIDDQDMIVQAYNYGTNYIYYVVDNGKKHSSSLAERFSKEVLAPMGGNLNAATYPYVNAVSQADGRKYLYWNGGNFHYPGLVKQYLTSGAEGVGNAKGWKKKAITAALADVGNRYPTGFGQRGECVVAIQTWFNGNGGYFATGNGVHANYVLSQATEVKWNQVKPGDVIQYENLLTPEGWIAGVHTMLVTKVNKNGTVDIVESNNPGGTGLVGTRKNVKPEAPPNFRTVVWRFPD